MRMAALSSRRISFIDEVVKSVWPWFGGGMYCMRFLAGVDHAVWGMAASGKTQFALVHPAMKYGSPGETAYPSLVESCWAQ